MSPTELKAVFRRILMGAAAPVLLADCGGGGGVCGNYHPPPAYTATAGMLADGGADCSNVCDAGYFCEPLSATMVRCNAPLCTGRNPAGTIETDLSQLKGLGGYLASMAHFEAASVAAFNQLADELFALEAPDDLVARAMQAAHEEVIHAEQMARLSRRRGVTPPAPRLSIAPRRGLEGLAIDNASEGCVREAFGALIGLHQSAHATARDVREAMAKIAHDEISHAAFSFDVARHLRSRLEGAARARVDAAQEAALDALLHQAFESADPPFAAELGLPSADT